MALPWKYSLLSPRRRKLATWLTVGGIALVVILFLVISGLAEGLTYVFASTGRPDNLIIVRSGTSSVAMSRLGEEALESLRFEPEVAHDGDGNPLLSAEVLENLYLPLPDGGRMPVSVRGVDPVAYRVHDGIHLVSGRLPGVSTDEAIVGTGVARVAGGLEPGSEISLGGTDWRVVGVFESGGDIFESEVWVDRRTLLGLRMRTGANYAVARIAGGATAAKAAEKSLESSAWLGVRAGVENLYYLRSNAGGMSAIRRVRRILVIVMAFAMAVTGTNTMYALIAARQRELGTLRVLGFRPRDLLVAVLVESILVGLAGGVAGGLLSLFVQGVSVVYQGVILHFRIGGLLVLEGVAIAIVIGAVGGLLPAGRAARLEVVDTLRAL
jgi:putative ABC transport system permease protein